MPDVWAVPPMWPGATVACLGGGPSLTAHQAGLCRGRARVIAINDAYRLAPWADLLYFCDHRWWNWHRGAAAYESFAGLRVTLDARVAVEAPDVKYVHNAGREGLSVEPGHLMTGRNGGYQAINLAVQLGAKRILLLGYDMRAVDGRTHWFGDHPTETRPSVYEGAMLPMFETLVAPLATSGVEVVNCTPGSALATFPTSDLTDALSCPPPTASCPSDSPTAAIVP